MEIETLLPTIVDELTQVQGVRAIVLGGSRARGTHTPSSDIDLGIYYHPDNPFDLSALRRVAQKLDDEHRADVVTPPGGWGPWINGGGWLKIQSMPVDFVYRDLDRVSGIIDDCHGGKVEIYYQPGHPFGFVSAIYLAEVAVCQPLWDPDGVVRELKARVMPYPAALRQALIQKFAWEIDFSLMVAKKSIARADVAYAAGSCFRSVMCMAQFLFALNGEYCLNEKGAVALANTFALKPERFQERVGEAFHLLDAKGEAIASAVKILDELSQDIAPLVTSQA